MKRLGFLGGTFNPIHIGHLILAEQAYSEFDLDKVLIVPSGNPYFKENIKVLQAEKRLEMCRIAVSDNAHFEVSDIEVRREGDTYTFETLEELHKIYPDAELYFICGADIIKQIKLWKHPEKVFKLSSIIAAVRDDCDILDLTSQIEIYKRDYDARIEIMHTGRMDISSTDLRLKIRDSKTVRYFIPDNVIEYIRKNKIYMDEV